MGRLFLSRLSLFCIISMLISNCAFAQNTFYIFKKSGQPYFKIDLPVQRGSVFNNSDTLTLSKIDTVLLINNLGELFELNEPRTYVYNTLHKYRKRSNNNSLTSKYFSFVWKQFTNRQKSRQRPGVVYREERDIKLNQPMDSIKWYVPEILFSWQNRTETITTYFHLQNIETKHITKIGTSSDSLILFRDNTILESGNKYQWAVTTEPFPDFNTIRFNNFELLTQEAYLKLKSKMKALKQALGLLGFSEEDIKEVICLDYKFCDL